MINLSPDQSKIVQQNIDKSIQVLASAGTGKTRVLTERVRYILKNTKRGGIIALTFTNKAAEEMRKRLENSDSVVDRCWIATIHSVAQRILEQYAHTIGMSSELNIYDRAQDRKTIFLQALFNSNISVDSLLKTNKVDSDYEKERNKIIQHYMERFSRVKRELLTENQVKERYGSNFLSVFKNYQEELKNSGGIDFDDILVYAHRILMEQPWCAKIYGTKYKYICVDEAQDLNKAQYELIKALYGGGAESIIMVGDPDQMIYGFNGSSTQYLCDYFIKDFSPLQFKITENYRSSKSVIRLANLLKPDSQKESEFALEGRDQILSLENEEEEANWIYQKIKEVLEQNIDDIEGPISLSNIVVIARSRFVFHTLEKILKKNNIKYVFKKSKPLLEPVSCFGKVFDLSIRLKLNPKDWISGKKLCELLKINIPDSRDSEYVLGDLADRLNHSDILLSELQKNTIRGVHNINSEQPKMLKLFKMIKTVLNKQITSIQNNHLVSEETEKELEFSFWDFNKFQEYWNLFRQKQSETSLLAFKNAIILSELVMADTDNNIPALTLSTVHTMKGMEKDIVFLMGMCEGVFPDYRAKERSEVSEERNSAFVAVTRARRWIYITYPKQRKMPWGDDRQQRESRFVTEMKNNTSTVLPGSMDLEKTV